MSMDKLFLELEQEELLAKLIQAHERLSRSERRDFEYTPAYIRKGSHPRSFWEESIDSRTGVIHNGQVFTKKESIPWNLDHDTISHPGFPGGTIDTTQSDIDFLSEQG